MTAKQIKQLEGWTLLIGVHDNPDEPDLLEPSVDYDIEDGKIICSTYDLGLEACDIPSVTEELEVGSPDFLYALASDIICEHFDDVEEYQNWADDERDDVSIYLVCNDGYDYGPISMNICDFI